MYYTPEDYEPKSQKDKILVIGKSIEDLTESETDEVLNELVKNGTLKKDKNGNYFKVHKTDCALRPLTDKDIDEVCQVCSKELNLGDIVRPFVIGGGGLMYWCRDCDSTDTEL